MSRVFDTVSNILFSFGMDTCASLLQKIDAIYTINKEIIGRINSIKTADVHTSALLPLQNKVPQFQLKIEKTPVDGIQEYLQFSHLLAKNILAKWTTNSKLEEIKDIFNDNIDYNVTNYQQVASLNSKMHQVVSKYELFGESPKAAIELNKFKNNFEIIQTMLGTVDTVFLPMNDSNVLALNQKVDLINKLLQEVSLACTPPSTEEIVQRELEWDQGTNIYIEDSV